jgi:hypothetical protein
MATSLINTECKRYGCMKNLLACYANCRYNGRCDDLRNEILPNLEQAANDINTYRRERELSSIEIQLLKRGLKFVDVASLQKNLAQRKQSRAKPLPKKRVKRKIKAVKSVIEKVRPEARKPVLDLAKPEMQKVPGKTLTQIGKRKSVAKKRLASVPEKKASAVKNRTAPTEEKPSAIVKRSTKARGKKIQLKSENRVKMAKKINDSVSENARLSSEANQANLINVAEKTSAARRKKSGGQEAAAKKKKRMYIILDGERSALVDEKGLMTKLLAGVSPNARYFEATEIELRLQIAHKK